MSKAIAGAVLVLLGGTAVSGGVFLANSKSSDKDQQEKDATLPKTLEDFKSKAKDQACVKALFPGFTSVGSETDSTNVDKSFFTENKASEGCLIVNWDKRTKDSKWSGNLRLLWAAQGEGTGGAKKGFMVFLAGKTPDAGTPQEIQWEGGIYTLSSASGTTTWTSKKLQEVNSGTKTFKNGSGDEATKKFPHPGSALTGKGNSGTVPDFWNLMSGANDVTNVTAPATDVPETSFRGHWKWSNEVSKDKESSKKKMADWTKDLESWWKEVFDANKFKAKELSEAQQGLWTQVFWSSSRDGNNLSPIKPGNIFFRW